MSWTGIAKSPFKTVMVLKSIWKPRVCKSFIPSIASSVNFPTRKLILSFVWPTFRLKVTKPSAFCTLPSANLTLFSDSSSVGHISSGIFCKALLLSKDIVAPQSINTCKLTDTTLVPYKALMYRPLFGWAWKFKSFDISLLGTVWNSKTAVSELKLTECSLTTNSFTDLLDRSSEKSFSTILLLSLVIFSFVTVSLRNWPLNCVLY